MLVALGKDDVKTVEDFAGSVPDDLTGYVERKDGESKRFPGALEGFGLSRADAEAMIMAARVKAGWITEEDLHPAEEEDEAGEGDRAKPKRKPPAEPQRAGRLSPSDGRPRCPAATSQPNGPASSPGRPCRLTR